MRINSRNKGVRGELEAAKLLRSWFPDCQRSFGQARKGYEQPDIIGGGIEKHFYVEVKRPKHEPRPKTIAEWMDKAYDDSVKFTERTGLTPRYIVLMWRANHVEKWEVIFSPIYGVGEQRLAWGDFVKKLNGVIAKLNCLPAVLSPPKQTGEM